MKYLKYIDESKENIVDKIYLELSTDKEWKKSTELNNNFDYEYFFDIDENYKISIVKFKNINKLIFYIKDDDRFYFVDYVLDGIINRYKSFDPISRVIKISYENMPFFYDKKIMPNINELINIIFIELKEDFGFEFYSEEWGFTDNNFMKYEKSLYGHNIYDSYYETYFPMSNNSSIQPRMILKYVNTKHICTDYDDLICEFYSCKERLKIFKYNIKCDLFFIDVIHDELNEFIIVLEKNNM